MIKQNKYFINDIQSTSTIKYIAKRCVSLVESFYYKSYYYLYKKIAKLGYQTMHVAKFSVMVGQKTLVGFWNAIAEFALRNFCMV